ncbi:MAG: helix-turn-helix transcriptional regulator [Leucobacter sp.]|nr:helix-turn-helix transcriptional regulator [Leucobacter sp.]
MRPADPVDTHAIHCRLDELLAERQMTLTELSERVGVSIVNLSVLKNDRAKAIRFTTLTAICRVLGCTVGELLEVRREVP